MVMRQWVLPAALAAAVLAGCATSGRGYGVARSGGGHVDFTWQSKGGNEGDMTATLADGAVYSGPYFQITRDSTVERLQPLWFGWHGPWRGAPYWGAYPDVAFVTHYSGRVVANLAGPDGMHMRCHFRLKNPSAAMAGGGMGKCQLAKGQTIDAQFPAA